MNWTAYAKAKRADLLPGRSLAMPSDWCPANLLFDEAGNHGPFRLDGFEYWREPLDEFADSSVQDEVIVSGAQVGKTSMLMAGAAWCIVNDPCGFLWVMPSLSLAQKFSAQRWKHLLTASPVMRAYIPTGANRHDFAALTQILRGSTLNFVGSNSPANLGSHPCRRVILDETDKFNAQGQGDEADAISLAQQRTKKQPSPQRFKTSTPTVPNGFIWSELLKGDIRRYFIPCPSCSKRLVLAWSDRYCSLPICGAEAFIHWDPAAKHRDSGWDMAQVRDTAHAACPHCQNRIQDHQKSAIIKAGRWQPTNPQAAAGFRSRHLPSLYAVGPQTTFGNLAVRFLEQLHSTRGPQDFINSELAEPYTRQDRQTERITLQRRGLDTTDWQRLLTVDCQRLSPHFWYVVRAWKDGESHAIDAGSLEDWYQVESKQAEHHIGDAQVLIDSGYAAGDELGVYRHCAGRSELVDRAPLKLPLLLGWTPSKGQPGHKRWKSDTSALLQPFFLKGIDPFAGSEGGGQVEMTLVEFATDFFKDVLDRLRQGKTKVKWSVSEKVDSEVYWAHMNSEVRNARGFRHIWEPLWKGKPNHLLDCEVLQLVLASVLGLMSLET